MTDERKDTSKESEPLSSRRDGVVGLSPDRISGVSRGADSECQVCREGPLWNCEHGREYNRRRRTEVAAPTQTVTDVRYAAKEWRYQHTMTSDEDCLADKAFKAGAAWQAKQVIPAAPKDRRGLGILHDDLMNDPEYVKEYVKALEENGQRLLEELDDLKARPGDSKDG